MDVAEKIKVIGNGGGTSQAVLDAIDAINAVIATYGTMALQDDTSVDINGGSIDGTAIGATTAAAITGTTVTANTKFVSSYFDAANSAGGALRNASGTSQLQWGGGGGNNMTVDVAININPANSQVDLSPTGTGTVRINPATLSSMNNVTIGATIPAAGTFTTLNSTSGALNGTVGATTANTGKFTTLEATGTSSLGTASAQYMQVVGDANYPALKAAGSGTNIPAIVQPKGTGALQAQQTTSTATGGNARGANAVDWQTNRNIASKVASGAYSVISGGSSNASTGFATSVLGGTDNSTGGGNYTVTVGGYLNASASSNTAIVGGYGNTASGYYNFIGSGYANAGTSGSSVTTQSATMNGTTSVTLSGSNANIKVGQLVIGTSINTFPHTYVAAISGTSLTLSQAASGSSTSTLSFYTPHGVVVGGGNNQATGSYSFIGGGGDAGTAANRNVASGDWSFVGSGRQNTASGAGSIVVGGGYVAGGTAFANTASGITSAIVGGQGNTASGIDGFIGNGYQNTASGDYSAVINGVLGTTRGILGNQVASACNNPLSSGAAGTNQSGLLILGRQTTDATATVLTSSTAAANTTNQVILPNNSAYYFKGTVVAGKTAGGDTKGWTIEGVIKRGANAASTTVVGVTVASMYADAGAVTWTIAAAADTTNGGLKITATGQASTTIRWVCKIETTEMTY
jgi:hypothetical protein